MDSASGLDLDGVGVLGHQRAGSGLTLDGDGDLDGDFFAAPHDQQVGVLDVAADRVDLEAPWSAPAAWCPSMSRTSTALVPELRKSTAEKSWGRQQQVLGIGAVVQEVAPGPRGGRDGGTLAGLGADLDGQVVAGCGFAGHCCCSFEGRWSMHGQSRTA